MRVLQLGPPYNNHLRRLRGLRRLASDRAAIAAATERCLAGEKGRPNPPTHRSG